MISVKKMTYLIIRKTRDFFHCAILDFNHNEFEKEIVLPLEELSFLMCNDNNENLILEAVSQIIYFYFAFDQFDKIERINEKFSLNRLASEANKNMRFFVEFGKLESMIKIARDFASKKKNQKIFEGEEFSVNSQPIEIEINSENNGNFNKEIEENKKNNLIEDNDIKLDKYEIFTPQEKIEIFSYEKISNALPDYITISYQNRVKTANNLLLNGFIEEDYEILKKANEEFEFLIKENTEKNEESQIISDSYIGILILNSFISKSLLKISDLLESFSLVVELHGIPHWEKLILLLHTCEKIIFDQRNKPSKNEEKNIDVDNLEEEKIARYKEILAGFKKNMTSIILKLKNVETSFDMKFILDLFKEYIKPNDVNEEHSNLIISLAICYLVLEIRVAILDKKNEMKNTLKIFLSAFWNFLKILKNNKKYIIIKTFFMCISTPETSSFFKSIIFYIFMAFKHHFRNIHEVEKRENENIFTFNPMETISFEENSDFKTINFLLKSEKNKLRFDDYDEDKLIILHYMKFLFKREKEIDNRSLYNFEGIEPNKNEIQAFTKKKKNLIEKIKTNFLFFEYERSLR